MPDDGDHVERGEADRPAPVGRRHLVHEARLRAGVGRVEPQTPCRRARAGRCGRGDEGLREGVAPHQLLRLRRERLGLLGVLGGLGLRQQPPDAGEHPRVDPVRRPRLLPEAWQGRQRAHQPDQRHRRAQGGVGVDTPHRAPLHHQRRVARRWPCPPRAQVGEVGVGGRVAAGSPRRGRAEHVDGEHEPPRGEPPAHDLGDVAGTPAVLVQRVRRVQQGEIRTGRQRPRPSVPHPQHLGVLPLRPGVHGREAGEEPCDLGGVVRVTCLRRSHGVLLSGRSRGSTGAGPARFPRVRGRFPAGSAARTGSRARTCTGMRLWSAGGPSTRAEGARSWPCRRNRSGSRADRPRSPVPSTTPPCATGSSAWSRCCDGWPSRAPAPSATPVTTWASSPSSTWPTRARSGVPPRPATRSCAPPPRARCGRRSTRCSTSCARRRTSPRPSSSSSPAACCTRPTRTSGSTCSPARCASSTTATRWS